MSTLIVPDDGDTYWPTLGWGVAEFLTGFDYLRNEVSERFEGSVFGPGSLKGEPYKLDDEKLAATLRAYEVFPPEHRFAGRRRFKRVGISWRKGLAKTEWAAEIAFGELHPDGPVRFHGWQLTFAGDLVMDPYTGVPLPILGRPVNDPYIPMVAYNADQTEELAFGALQTIILEGPDNRYFDVGNERILRIDSRGMPDGKAVVLTGSPNANDGARTTFQHFDETHRMELPRLVDSHKTMLANIPKRPLDDPWSLETTTAGRPGAGSIAEGTHKFAQKVILGKIREPRLFYFHREASPKWDMRKFEDRVEAIKEATGPIGEYAPGQFEEIASQWDEPDSDKSYLERVWCNRWTKADAQAFDIQKFIDLLDDDNFIKPGAFCTLGFDGARYKDSTGFVLTEIVTGKQMVVGRWERPLDLGEREHWEVPEDEVNETFAQIMKLYKIWKLYGDPPHWVEEMGKWSGKYPDQVEEWWTNNRRKMAQAIRNYTEAMTSSQLHPFDPEDERGVRHFARHIGNAGKVETNLLDEDGKKLYILGKLHPPDSKFDIAMAGTLSWQARIDALSAGAVAEPDMFVPYRLDQGGRDQRPLDTAPVPKKKQKVLVEVGTIGSPRRQLAPRPAPQPTPRFR